MWLSTFYGPHSRGRFQEPQFRRMAANWELNRTEFMQISWAGCFFSGPVWRERFPWILMRQHMEIRRVCGCLVKQSPAEVNRSTYVSRCDYQKSKSHLWGRQPSSSILQRCWASENIHSAYTQLVSGSTDTRQQTPAGGISPA